MQIFSKNKIVFLFLAASCGLTACQNPSTTTVNGNQTNISNIPLVGNVNVITNTNSNTANGSLLTGENTGIEAREPEQYQAQVMLKLETGGTEKTSSLPPITAQVARSGNDKRMEFGLPGGEKLIYLSRGGQQFVISPQRKQYAELNKEALGMDIRQMMTPEQMVKQVKNIKGVERVGEEKLAGRDVIKYRYNATTQTKSQAGDVATEAVILVDKETGLPLRTETYVESQSGGSVSGMNKLRLVSEMSNLQMTAEPTLFAEPTDFKKVAPEEIRAQIDLVFRALAVFLEQAMKSQSTNNQTPTVNNSPTPATP